MIPLVSVIDPTPPFLQVLLGIEGVPPCGVVLEPSLEPGHLGGHPLDAFVVVEDVVVLALHLYECHLAA